MSYPARTIYDTNNNINLQSSAISKLEDHALGSFEISKGIILRVTEDRLKYQVQMPREGVTVRDVPLFLDSAYYQIVGFPNVGDIVKVIHKKNYAVAFIFARANDLKEELVMSKNSAVPKGANIP